jgi:hypothetical protein
VDRRQRRVEGRGETRVVEAAEGHVARHGAAGPAQGREGAGRHEVGGDEDGVEVGAPTQQLTHRGGPALAGVVAVGDQ